jgi:hypothetical protein
MFIARLQGADSKAAKQLKAESGGGSQRSSSSSSSSCCCSDGDISSAAAGEKGAPVKRSISSLRSGASSMDFLGSALNFIAAATASSTRLEDGYYIDRNGRLHDHTGRFVPWHTVSTVGAGQSQAKTEPAEQAKAESGGASLDSSGGHGASAAAGRSGPSRSEGSGFFARLFSGRGSSSSGDGEGRSSIEGLTQLAANLEIKDSSASMVAVDESATATAVVISSTSDNTTASSSAAAAAAAVAPNNGSSDQPLGDVAQPVVATATSASTTPSSSCDAPLPTGDTPVPATPSSKSESGALNDSAVSSPKCAWRRWRVGFICFDFSLMYMTLRYEYGGM